MQPTSLFVVNINVIRFKTILKVQS